MRSIEFFLLASLFKPRYKLLGFDTTTSRNVFGVRQRLERFDGGVRHVDGVSATERLSENVVDSACFKASSDCTTGLNTRSWRSWSEHDLSGSADSHDLVRDRLANHWDLEHCLSSSFFSLADGVGNPPSLSETNADTAFVVSNNDEDRPASSFSTLVGLKDLVCSDNSNVELRTFGIPALSLSAQSVHHSHGLELQPGFSSTIRKGCDSAVVLEAPTIKNNG
jgi:hypothetical protein